MVHLDDNSLQAFNSPCSYFTIDPKVTLPFNGIDYNQYEAKDFFHLVNGNLVAPEDSVGFSGDKVFKYGQDGAIKFTVDNRYVITDGMGNRLYDFQTEDQAYKGGDSDILMVRALNGEWSSIPLDPGVQHYDILAPQSILGDPVSRFFAGIGQATDDSQRAIYEGSKLTGLTAYRALLIDSMLLSAYVSPNVEQFFNSAINGVDSQIIDAKYSLGQLSQAHQGADKFAMTELLGSLGDGAGGLLSMPGIAVGGSRTWQGWDKIGSAGLLNSTNVALADILSFGVDNISGMLDTGKLVWPAILFLALAMQPLYILCLKRLGLGQAMMVFLQHPRPVAFHWKRALWWLIPHLPMIKLVVLQKIIKER